MLYRCKLSHLVVGWDVQQYTCIELQGPFADHTLYRLTRPSQAACFRVRDGMLHAQQRVGETGADPLGFLIAAWTHWWGLHFGLMLSHQPSSELSVQMLGSSGWVMRVNYLSTRTRIRVIPLVRKSHARLFCVVPLRWSVTGRLWNEGSEKGIPPIGFADLRVLSAGSLGFLPAQKKLTKAVSLVAYDQRRRRGVGKEMRDCNGFKRETFFSRGVKKSYLYRYSASGYCEPQRNSWTSAKWHGSQHLNIV